SNTATTNSSVLSNRVLSILYDMPALKEVKDGQQNWKDIEGVYESLNAGLRLQSNFGSKPAFLTIRVDSANRVSSQRTGAGAISLSPAGKDLLFDKSNPFTALKIERNAGGTVEGLRVHYHFPGTGPERYNKRTSPTVPPIRIPEKTDSTTLSKYAGWYENAFGDRVRLVIGNNQLFMEQPPVNARTGLLWIRGNTFWVKETDIEVNFDADAKGKITGMRFFSGFYDNTLRKIEEIY
ncbi:MAG: DUF3471 domain-containing protein, partial [Chitinophagaceae bacterium]|nr:DUF3471 domain-containing protein [Chitinophagaceae bacterium]